MYNLIKELTETSSILNNYNFFNTSHDTPRYSSRFLKQTNKPINDLLIMSSLSGTWSIIHFVTQFYFNIPTTNFLECRSECWTFFFVSYSNSWCFSRTTFRKRIFKMKYDLRNLRNKNTSKLYFIHNIIFNS